MTRLVNMWAGPRNVSTAMMYSWNQRADTTVWDEPMYGHYLVATGVDHPGRREILAAVATDPDEILSEMRFGTVATPVRFFKNMAHHLIGFDPAVVEYFDNFLLTRDPRDMLPSLAKGLDRVPTLRDTGFTYQIDIVGTRPRRGAPADRGGLPHTSRPPRTGAHGIVPPARSAVGPGNALVARRSEAGGRCVGGTLVRPAPHHHRIRTLRPEDGTVPPALEALYEQCRPLYERLAEYTIEV